MAGYTSSPSDKTLLCEALAKLVCVRWRDLARPSANVKSDGRPGRQGHGTKQAPVSDAFVPYTWIRAMILANLADVDQRRPAISFNFSIFEV